VVARPGRRNAGADGHALGRLAGGAEPHPRVARLARLPPGLEVIRAADAVEPGALRRDRLCSSASGEKCSCEQKWK
jgi:hypothetical protein